MSSLSVVADKTVEKGRRIATMQVLEKKGEEAFARACFGVLNDASERNDVREQAARGVWKCMSQEVVEKLGSKEVFGSLLGHVLDEKAVNGIRARSARALCTALVVGEYGAKERKEVVEKLANVIRNKAERSCSRYGCVEALGILVAGYEEEKEDVEGVLRGALEGGGLTVSLRGVLEKEFRRLTKVGTKRRIVEGGEAKGGGKRAKK